MTYFMIHPATVKPAWKVDKAIKLRALASGEGFYYCEGPEPQGGATYVKMDGDEGVIGYWPDFSTPPAEVHGHLTQTIEADEAKEQTT